MVRIFRACCLQREKKVFGEQNPLETYKKFGAGRFRMVSAGKTECYGRGKADMEEDCPERLLLGKTSCSATKFGNFPGSLAAFIE